MFTYVNGDDIATRIEYSVIDKQDDVRHFFVGLSINGDRHGLNLRRGWILDPQIELEYLRYSSSHSHSFNKKHLHSIFASAYGHVVEAGASLIA